MKKQQLNFRFHNPNTSEVLAEHLYQVFFKANKRKFDKILADLYKEQQETQKACLSASLEKTIKVDLN